MHATPSPVDRTASSGRERRADESDRVRQVVLHHGRVQVQNTPPKPREIPIPPCVDPSTRGVCVRRIRGGSAAMVCSYVSRSRPASRYVTGFIGSLSSSLIGAL